MRVLVTGHKGYIGCVLVPLFQAAGHEVVGLDSDYFSDCTFGEDTRAITEMHKDVRDVEPADLRNFDAVIHLAAKVDGVGYADPRTYRIKGMEEPIRAVHVVPAKTPADAVLALHRGLQRSGRPLLSAGVAIHSLRAAAPTSSCAPACCVMPTCRRPPPSCATSTAS